jgi:hypothetical protein
MSKNPALIDNQDLPNQNIGSIRPTNLTLVTAAGIGTFLGAMFLGRDKEGVALSQKILGSVFSPITSEKPGILPFISGREGANLFDAVGAALAVAGFAYGCDRGLALRDAYYERLGAEKALQQQGIQ